MAENIGHVKENLNLTISAPPPGTPSHGLYRQSLSQTDVFPLGPTWTALANMVVRKGTSML